MTDDENVPPGPARSRGGAMPIYILAAVLAAIAGFSAMSLLAPGKVVTTATDNGAPASGGGSADISSGLERLVRVNPPTLLSLVDFTDGDGHPHTLGEWRGKVVLVNLWATWCAPCKREMPSLDRLQAKLGGADFAVLPISLDRTGPEKPRQFLASNGLKDLDLYLDRDSKLMEIMRAPGLPLSVLIDRQGREFARIAGPAEWDTAEAEALIRTAIAKAGDE